MNIILQHWNGDMPSWAKIAEKTVRDYCARIGCEYELLRGHPMGKDWGPNPQKLAYLLERFDKYDQTLMIDMDMIATKSNRNVFDLNEIGVIHERAMKDDGSSLTPDAARPLYKKGEYIFFGNFIKLHREQRIKMREHLDKQYIASVLKDKYAGDETVLSYLFWKSGVLEGKSIEDVCMRCSGTSHEDIHFRDHNRLDRKFANLSNDSSKDPISGSDKDATFIHFGQSRKNNIASFVSNLYGEIYAWGAI